MTKSKILTFKFYKLKKKIPFFSSEQWTVISCSRSSPPNKNNKVKVRQINRESKIKKKGRKIPWEMNKSTTKIRTTSMSMIFQFRVSLNRESLKKSSINSSPGSRPLSSMKQTYRKTSSTTSRVWNITLNKGTKSYEKTKKTTSSRTRCFNGPSKRAGSKGSSSVEHNQQESSPSTSESGSKTTTKSKRKTSTWSTWKILRFPK